LMYFVQLEFFAIIMVNAKEFLIFRVSLDNQTEPGDLLDREGGILKFTH